MSEKKERLIRERSTYKGVKFSIIEYKGVNGLSNHFELSINGSKNDIDGIPYVLENNYISSKCSIEYLIDNNFYHTTMAKGGVVDDLKHIRDRANRICNFQYDNTSDTERKWVSKQMDIHIEKYGEPKRFDDSDEAITYTTLKAAYNALKDLKKMEQGGSIGGSVSSLQKSLKKKYSELKTLLLSEYNNVISIDMIEVDSDKRKEGVGSAVIQEIVNYADTNKKEISLLPALSDDRKGTTSRSRLVKFYKRFGFVENKGRNKDFSKKGGSMYRLPKMAKGGSIDTYATGGKVSSWKVDKWSDVPTGFRNTPKTSKVNFKDRKSVV